MDNQTKCPSCRRLLRVPDSLLGQHVKCPACGENFPAVLEEEAPEPPRRPEPPPERFERDDREEDRPSRRRRRDEDEDDEPEDDRPRRRRRRRHYDEHRGTLVLVMGICAWVIAPIPCGPIAWFLGAADLREIAAGRMDPEGESQTRIGMILGIVSTLLSLVAILVFCVVFSFIMFVASSVR